MVALNRAIAIGMRDGPDAGLAGVEDVLALPGMQTYHPAHGARARVRPPCGAHGRRSGIFGTCPLAGASGAGTPVSATSVVGNAGRRPRTSDPDTRAGVPAEAFRSTKQ